MMTNKYFLFDWENSTKDEILDEFEFEGDKSEIEILFASYIYEWYNGEAFLIVKKENKLYEVNGGHCSCYGLENQFNLEETSIEQLEFYLEKGNKFKYHYGKDFIKEKLIDFIKHYKEKRKMKKELEELISNVQKWSINKELHKADPIKQTVKLVEELGELSSGLLKDKKEVVIDSLGDMLVVLIILHQQLGLTIEESLEFAWNEIKDRKGEMKNGVFVKEEDL